MDRLIVETTDETKERDKDEVVAVLVAEDLPVDISNKVVKCMMVKDKATMFNGNETNLLYITCDRDLGRFICR